VKVTDFGIAKASGSGDLTSAGTIIGTARYLAPEQVRGEPADGRADVYAVGLLLHEMLAGSLPFHGDSEMGAALARLSVAPDPLPESVPAGVQAIVARSLAVDPGARWPSAHALAAALDAALRGETIPGADGTAARGAVAPPPPPVDTAPPRAAQSRPRPQPRRQRAAWPWALLGAVLLGAGAGGGYLLVQDLGKDGGGLDGDPVSAELVEANDFDPLGDNGEENSDLAQLVLDGDTETAWRTETYSTRELGGKEGVGIYVVLSELVEVSSVEVLTREAGWDAEIYVASSASSTLAGWGSPVSSGEELGTTGIFDIDPSSDAGVILVWITRVPDSGRVEVFEVRVG
jgi:hypothetical protein